MVVQTSCHVLAVPRLRMLSVTGEPGSGKRTDSWNVRLIVFASSVVAHSSKMEPKPAE